MVQNDILYYNNGFIEAHPIYRIAPSTLQFLSEKDYPNKYHFPIVLALDMDKYESTLASGRSGCTMDAVIGIQKSAHESVLMLVELRMGYKNIENLSTQNIISKITHTRDLLGSEIPIHSEKVFIFDSKFLEQARWWFDRKGKEMSELLRCQPYSVEKFVLSLSPQKEELVRFIPNHSSDSIIQDLRKCQHCFYDLLDKVVYWADLSKSYGESEERAHIRSVLHNFWKEEESRIKQDQNFDNLYFQMIEEDYPWIH